MANCKSEELPCDEKGCWDRRQFALATGAGGVTLLLSQIFPGRVVAEDASIQATISPFPRIAIGKLSELKNNEPVAFEYPPSALHGAAMLVKLGTTAGGGIGPEQDVVAYSTRCTHMGADLTYNAEHQLAGPCSEHLTSFDLKRHGMVVAGHATQALPQILLELSGDEIFAVGIIGLMFGYYTNPTNESQSERD